MTSNLLVLENLSASYGNVPALHDVSLTISAGEVVVLLGANGAGKTTCLRAISRSTQVSTTGRIKFDDKPFEHVKPEEVVRFGMAHVPQGRGTFADLTVEDNLNIGGFTSPPSEIQERKEEAYSRFPRLRDRRNQSAGSLSGGEQQMLAVARGLMSKPRLLLLDEPSMGLAPLIVQELFEQFAELNRSTGLSLLIVEQNAQLALEIADRGYVIENGSVVAEDSALSLRHNDAIRQAYLGF